MGAGAGAAALSAAVQSSSPAELEQVLRTWDNSALGRLATALNRTQIDPGAEAEAEVGAEVKVAKEAAQVEQAGITLVGVDGNLLEVQPTDKLASVMEVKSFVAKAKKMPWPLVKLVQGERPLGDCLFEPSDAVPTGQVQFVILDRPPHTSTLNQQNGVNAGHATVDLAGKMANESGYMVDMRLAALSRCKKAEELNVSYNDLDDENAFVLAHAIKSMSNLIKLSLRDNHIGDEGLTSILGALPHSLQVLILSSNQITDAGAGILADALAHIPNIQQIELGDNLICPEGHKLLREKALALPELTIKSGLFS